MLAESAQILVLMDCEVKRHPRVGSGSDVPVIVVKSLLLDVLVLSS